MPRLFPIRPGRNHQRLDPPGIEATCVRAGHPAGTGQEPQIGHEFASTLPQRCRMEIQSLLTRQRTEIDVHCSPEAIPTRKSLLLLALEVPEGIADVLKIEVHSTLLQARPLATPVPEEVTVRALTRLVTIRARERFLLRTLGMSGKCKRIETAPQ